MGGSEGGGGGEMNNISEDPLEKFSEEYQEDIIHERADGYTTIKKYLTDYVSTVVEQAVPKLPIVKIL